MFAGPPMIAPLPPRFPPLAVRSAHIIPRNCDEHCCTQVLHQIAHKSGLLRGKGVGGPGSRNSPSPALAALRQQQRTPGGLLSPAAQALATKLKGGARGSRVGGTDGAGGTGKPGSDRDASLRASYSQQQQQGTRGASVTPGGSGGMHKSSTPCGTPSRAAAGASGRSSGAGTPKVVHVGSSGVLVESKLSPGVSHGAGSKEVAGDITDNLLNL